MRPHTSESRQKILVLSQFHLHLGVGSLGALSENVKNQACAVENLHLQFFLHIRNLLGGEVIIENHQSHFVIFNKAGYLLEFTFSDKGTGIG